MGKYDSWGRNGCDGGSWNVTDTGTPQPQGGFTPNQVHWNCHGLKLLLPKISKSLCVIWKWINYWYRWIEIDFLWSCRDILTVMLSGWTRVYYLDFSDPEPGSWPWMLPISVIIYWYRKMPNCQFDATWHCVFLPLQWTTSMLTIKPERWRENTGNVYR